MDHIRKTLDELMGKDRDIPLKEKMKHQKHFDSPEVCKYYLLDFCPHDLFPNTKSDLGPCKKRHDQQFKIQFMRDPNKEQYQQKYEENLMDFLEELIAEVDNKMKKCVERIEAPLPETERSKEVTDRIRKIDMQIGELIEQAERFGEVGRIDDSEIIMRSIDQLKEQKNEILVMSEHPLIIKEKQMKVCEVCGAMQSMQDNEKRLQTHVEGKLHSGYAKIREYLEMLRRRKLERKYKIEEEREKERLQKEMKDKEKVREREFKDKDRRRYDTAGNKYQRKRFSRSRSRSHSFEQKFEKRDFRKTNRYDSFRERGDREMTNERYDKFDRNRNDQFRDRDKNENKYKYNEKQGRKGSKSRSRDNKHNKKRRRSPSE